MIITMAISLLTQIHHVRRRRFWFGLPSHFPFVGSRYFDDVGHFDDLTDATSGEIFPNHDDGIQTGTKNRGRTSRPEQDGGTNRRVLAECTVNLIWKGG